MSDNCEPSFEKSSPAARAQAEVNPTLTPNLRANYDALENDLRQAQDLAADFQGQLAGKSNELAGLKQVLEKTQRDLAMLQTTIALLREERHRLANEAMKVEALELRLERIVAERDCLKNEVAALRSAKGTEEAVRLERQKVGHLARLKTEIQLVRQQLATTGAGDDLRVAAAIENLDESFRQIATGGSGEPAAPAHETPAQNAAPAAPENTEEMIEISFTT